MYPNEPFWHIYYNVEDEDDNNKFKDAFKGKQMKGKEKGKKNNLYVHICN